jgi:hypothetical protein
MRVVSPSVFASNLIERTIADIAGPSDNFDSIGLPVSRLVIRHAWNIERITCHADEPQVTARDGVRAILFRVRGLWMRHSEVRTLGDGALRVDGLSRDPVDADKQENAMHRPNEKKISFGHRD